MARWMASGKVGGLILERLDSLLVLTCGSCICDFSSGSLKRKEERKQDQAEGTLVCDRVLRIALAHPERAPAPRNLSMIIYTLAARIGERNNDLHPIETKAGSHHPGPLCPRRMLVGSPLGCTTSASTLMGRLMDAAVQ